MNELAQLPTPMIATRTLPSLRTWPLDEPFDSDTGSTSENLLADVEHALDDRDPGRDGEEQDRPGQHAPGCEHETRGDDDDTLRTRADADVAAQAESLGARTGVGDEDRAGDCGDGHRDEDVVAVAREDERDRREHASLADPVGRRVEEGAERGRLAAFAGERAVEDVEERADHEDEGAGPVEDVAPVLEDDQDRAE